MKQAVVSLNQGNGDGVETDKKGGTGTINSLLVETPFKLSPTSMAIAVLSVRFFASSISVIIVNFCFLLKFLWRLLGAFFFCCMIN